MRFMGFVEERRGLRAINATIALHRLAGAVLQRYTLAKARRAALDYEDLIAKSVFLLGGQELASWVMFKLDRGIDHILVDEAQDTSPEQWQIVKALASEFFGDAGARSEVRTLFVVGDEKQSIYSFQGADLDAVRRHGQGVRRDGAATPGSPGGASPSICRSAPFRRCSPPSTASLPTMAARPACRAKPPSCAMRASPGPRRRRRGVADRGRGRHR